MRDGGAPSGLGSFQLDDLIEIVVRRWAWLLGGALLGMLVGLGLYYTLPTRYTANTAILVEPQEVPRAFIQSTVTLQVDRRLNTLRERVTSFTNLNELIDRIGVERLDPRGELGREGLMGLIRANLDVDIGGQSAREAVVFEVTYSGEDAQVVTEVTREIAGLFISENLKDRARQASATADFLDRELDRLRSDVTAQEQKLRLYKQENMGALPSELEANLRSLDRLNLELGTNLESQEAIAARVTLLRRQLQEASTQGVGDGRAVPGSLAAALQQAREALFAARRVYTDEHPNVRHLLEEVDRLEAELAQAGPRGGTYFPVDPNTRRVREELAAAQAELDLRRAREDRLREDIAGLQSRVSATPELEQELLILSRDYDNLVATYQRLLDKKHQAALARNLEQAQKGERFKVLRPARVPGTPSWPDVRVLVPAGTVGGLALVAALIAFIELRRPSFRSVELLRKTLGLPVVASIPRIDNDRIYEEAPSGAVDPRLVVYTAPTSAPAEQYRSFAPVFLEDESRRVVLVTSAARGDGKSLTCMNLALTIACDLNRRVLVIDGDLRRPTAHRLLRVRARRGLTDILPHTAELSEAAIETRVPNVTLLPAGRPVANPLALLTHPSFFELIEKARQSYDAVFIDSPPLLPVVDTQFLKKMADMVLFVVRSGATPRDAVVRSLEDLRSVAGLVFNEVSPHSFRRYYYHDAYARYAYGDEPGKPVEDADPAARGPGGPGARD